VTSARGGSKRKPKKVAQILPHSGAQGRQRRIGRLGSTDQINIGGMPSGGKSRDHRHATLENPLLRTGVEKPCQ
jgi:hypothetical protein